MAAVDEHGGEVGLRRRKTSNAAPGDEAQPAEVVARSSDDDDYDAITLILAVVVAAGVALRVYFAMTDFSVLHADEFYQVSDAQRSRPCADPRAEALTEALLAGLVVARRRWSWLTS